MVCSKTFVCCSVERNVFAEGVLTSCLPSWCTSSTSNRRRRNIIEFTHLAFLVEHFEGGTGYFAMTSHTSDARSTRDGSESSSVLVPAVFTTFVVFTCADGFRTEDIVEVVAPVGEALDPLFDGAVHFSVKLELRVAEGWVVEDTADVVEYLIDWNVWMVPCVDDAGCSVLQNGRGDGAGRAVEDVGEVILAE